MVGDIEELGNLDASEIHVPKRLNAKEMGNVQKG